MFKFLKIQNYLVLIVFVLFLLASPINSFAAFFQIFESRPSTSGSEYVIGSASTGNYIYSSVNRSLIIDGSKIKVLNKNTGEFIKEVVIPNSRITSIMSDNINLYVSFESEDFYGQSFSPIRIYDLNLNYIKRFLIAPEINQKILDYGTKILVSNGIRENGNSRIVLIEKNQTSPGIHLWNMYPSAGTKFFGISRYDNNNFVYYGTNSSGFNFLEVRKISDHSLVNSINVSFYASLGNITKVIFQDGSFFLLFNTNKLVKVSLQDMYKIDGEQKNVLVGREWTYQYVEPPTSCPTQFYDAGWTSSNKTNGVTAGYCFVPVYPFSKKQFVRDSTNCLTAIGCFLKPGQVSPPTITVSSTLLYPQPSSYKDYYYDKGFGSNGILDLGENISFINSVSIFGSNLTIGGIEAIPGALFGFNPKILRIQKDTGSLTSTVKYSFSGYLFDVFNLDQNTSFASGNENGLGYVPVVFKLGNISNGDTIRSVQVFDLISTFVLTLKNIGIVGDYSDFVNNIKSNVSVGKVIRGENFINIGNLSDLFLRGCVPTSKEFSFSLNSPIRASSLNNLYDFLSKGTKKYNLADCDVNRVAKFSASQSIYEWTVPSGVNFVRVDASSGGGGGGGCASSCERAGGSGGPGGLWSGVISVTPGEIVKIFVGGGGQGGTSNYSGNANAGGGGGGGFSSFGNKIFVGGGGGGGGGSGSSGGSDRPGGGGLGGVGGGGGGGGGGANAQVDEGKIGGDGGGGGIGNGRGGFGGTRNGKTGGLGKDPGILYPVGVSNGGTKSEGGNSKRNGEQGVTISFPNDLGFVTDSLSSPSGGGEGGHGNPGRHDSGNGGGDGFINIYW